MTEVLFILLGACAFFLFLYMVDMFKTKTSDCEHTYDQWSRMYEVNNYLVQERYCDKCGVAEVHKVRVE